MTRVAAVDIGTNSTRLLIAEGTEELARESIVTRLGEGVDASGRLGEPGQQRVLDVLQRFKTQIGDAHGAAVMTSAVRDAANGARVRRSAWPTRSASPPASCPATRRPSSRSPARPRCAPTPTRCW